MAASSSSSNSSSGSKPKSIPYVLEKRDGSLLKQTIRLDDSVESILKSLAKALELTGASSLPPPPPPAPAPADTDHRRPLDANSILWAPSSSSASSGASTGNRGTNSHSFDINTQKGRDLMAFLKATPPDEIEKRRMHRMDASAAALVARQLFSFQAVDGISMGWSSESFAVLLRSLISLHEEHSSRFHVDSFYPLRLVFSFDDFHSALDLYGGILYLHPAATQLQMLETLQNVTDEKLEEFQRNRADLQQRTSLLQNELGVKVTKGFSCSSKEYHLFLERIVQDDNDSCFSSEHSQKDGLAAANTALELERVRLVVESPAACRRARLTKEGYVQSHAQMTLEELRAAIARWSPSARQRRDEQRQEEQRCKEAIQEIQWAVGLQKVSRRGMLSHSEFLGSLSRLMEDRDKVRSWMAGYSLGIAGDGHFCHLADDGSIVLPHNWT
jgi:hypothetical protein